MQAVSNKINHFIDYVEKHLLEPVPTAEAIAQEIHMSRSTLFRLVEKELGMSPFQFIRQAKLKKAKDLLEKNNYKNIKELAQAVGYTRADYFALIFKEEFKEDLKKYFK